MQKKLLFITLIISILIKINISYAETSVLIPLKKPTLSNEEIAKKLSKNILKPLKKPKKNDSKKNEEKK
jgi:soluble lytic murein transglycosylase